GHSSSSRHFAACVHTCSPPKTNACCMLWHSPISWQGKASTPPGSSACGLDLGVRTAGFSKEHSSWMQVPSKSASTCPSWPSEDRFGRPKSPIRRECEGECMFRYVALIWNTADEQQSGTAAVLA